MKAILYGLILSCTFAFGQMGQSPPQTTPPTFPENHPRTQMPPETQAPPPREMSAKQVEAQIQQKFAAEPALASTNVRAKVDDTSVVLTGTVDTEGQHELAVRIAKPYAGDRSVVDNIKVKRQT